MKRKIKVTIDRSKWRTGSFSDKKTGKGHTELLNREGCMCCLGFCMAASKVAKKDLLGKTGPGSAMNGLKSDGEKLERMLRSNGVRDLTCFEPSRDVYECTDLANDAMKINDSLDTTPKQKEKAILELFKDSVFNIEFIGEYPKKEKQND